MSLPLAAGIAACLFAWLIIAWKSSNAKKRESTLALIAFLIALTGIALGAFAFIEMVKN